MTPDPLWLASPGQLSALVTAACVLEVSAPKPGNVSPGRPFRDMTYEDFVAAAVAIGPPLGNAGECPLGESILAAVTASRVVTRANTNLGIILLLAPLAKAAARLCDPAGRPAQTASALRESLVSVLASTTVADARLAYQAIRTARPGGMGTAGAQDLAVEPTVTLLEAMALAAERDLVAREYTTGFRLTFETGVPALQRARRAGRSREEAVVEAFLGLLAREPDTLIARKLGPAVAAEISAEAREIVGLGDLGRPEARNRLAAFDASLRDRQNSRNPGATADLTAAALFVALLQDAGAADDPRTSRAQ